MNERRRELLYHVIPAWISALAGLCAVILTAYTLLIVHSTEGKVSDIMQSMERRAPETPAPPTIHHGL